MPQILMVVTIDTEADYQPVDIWVKSNPITFRSVSEGIPRVLQPLFNQFNIAPTYLISPEVLEHNESVKTLKSLAGKYELGAHLHGEHIEPEKKYPCPDGTIADMYQCLYPPEIESAKLRNLSKLFKDKFGYSPVSFRAGRYGAGGNTIRSLEQLGYKVDTSITPHLAWRDASGKQAVDFTNAPEQPYFPDKDRIISPGESNILEVPISIVKKLLRHPAWLRPSYSTAKKMIQVIETLGKKYGRNELPVVLNMMFHSMEITPGASPLNKTPKEVAAFLQKMRTVFDYCLKQGIHSVTLSELYPLFYRRENE